MPVTSSSNGNGTPSTRAAAALAAPPASDEAKTAAFHIMQTLTPLVADAAIVGETWGWADVTRTVDAAAARLKAQAPPASAPPGLVAVVREYQEAERVWGDNEDQLPPDVRRARVARVQAAEKAVLAFPLPASPETPEQENRS